MSSERRRSDEVAEKIAQEVVSEVSSVSKTPEGVPDDANYLAPDEEAPEGAQMFEGPGGATYYIRAEEITTEAEREILENIDPDTVSSDLRSVVAESEFETVGEEATLQELETALSKVESGDLEKLSHRDAFVAVHEMEKSGIDSDDVDSLREFAEEREKNRRMELVDRVDVGEEFDGFEPFVVGGAVRDYHLGEQPEDIDLMAVPDGVENPVEILSERMEYVDAESAFPVFLDSEGREVALPRTEKSTGPGYDDFEAEIVDSGMDVEDAVMEDFERRDMTLGAMGVNARDGEKFDPFDGHESLLEREIIPVSDAFKEDPVRLLRTARFAPRFELDVGDDIRDMADDMRDGVEALPDERVMKELRKTMYQAEDAGRFFDILDELDVLDISFPEIDSQLSSVKEAVNEVSDVTSETEPIMASIGSVLGEGADQFIENHTLSSEEKKAVGLGREVSDVDEFTAADFVRLASRSDGKVITPEVLGALLGGLENVELGEEIEASFDEAVSVVDEVGAEQVMEEEGVSPQDIGDEISGEEFGQMVTELQVEELVERLGSDTIERGIIEFQGDMKNIKDYNTHDDGFLELTDPPSEISGRGLKRGIVRGVVSMFKTPEGVPESAEHISGEEETPEGAVIIPGPRGGKYAVSPDEFPDEVEMTDAVAQFISETGMDMTEPGNSVEDYDRVDEANEAADEVKDNLNELVEEYGKEEAFEILGALNAYADVVEDSYHGWRSDLDESDEEPPDLGVDEDADEEDVTIEGIHNEIEPGDTVVVDASENPEIPDDEIEAEATFVGPDWADIEINGRQVTVETENIEDYEIQSILPDMEFLERYDAGGSDILSAAIGASMGEGYDDYGEEIRERAEEMSPTGNISEESVQVLYDAAREVLLEEEGREGLEAYSEALDSQVRPYTLTEGEVDDVPTEERLDNCFDFAEEIKGLREAGIEGGETKGDEMELAIYADGSRDFMTPTDAYFGAYADTGVVEGPNEAVRNNRDSPKVIEALGGSTCKVSVTEDPSGEEYIVKEGIEGKTLAELQEEGGEIFDTPEKEQAALDTLTAAYFVGNGDLHRENLVVSEDGELTVIDHDNAGPPKQTDDWMHPTDIATFVHEIDSNELQFQIYEMAADIVRGDTELPDDLGEEHREYVERAANEALKTAQRDPTANVSDELVGDSDVDDVVNYIDELDEGDRILFYDPVLGEEIEGEVKFIQRDDGDMIAMVWDDEGYEYEVEDPTKIEEVL